MPKAYSEDLRKRVMGFLKNGGSKAEAVRRFAVSKGSVARWEKRLRETGKVAAHTQGRKRGVSKVAAAALQDYVTAHPDQNLIEIGEHFGVSSVMIWKRLKQIGFTFKKKSFLYQERSEEKRQVFRTLIAPIPVEQLVYVDEVGIDHNTRLTRGWAKRGQRLYADKPGNRTGRTSAIAALCGRCLHSPFCFEGYCTADLFNLYLEQCLVPNLEPGQTVVLDNARFHQSKRTRHLIEAAQCKLLFLPPYSPDLNNIEHQWFPLKHHYAKLQSVFDTPADAVNAAFRQMIQ